ncbi:hypothetical protein MRB53_041816 [Persea americana]|nr:hypothetical protein MRB53_041816 [Persea americana]
MASASASLHIRLAHALPVRLQRFFVRNPPRALTSTSAASPPATASHSTSTSPSDFSSATAPSAATLNTAGLSSSALTEPRNFKRNPFLPHKTPGTGKWRPPIYSLRQQAELCKMARAHDVEDLLPYSTKSSIVRNAKREEQGLRVKGTGVGQRVKGHEWERTLKGRLDKRRAAMVGMASMVQKWKQVCISVLMLLGYTYLVSGMSADLATERTWKRLEAVAEIVVASIQRPLRACNDFVPRTAAAVPFASQWIHSLPTRPDAGNGTVQSCPSPREGRAPPGRDQIHADRLNLHADELARDSACIVRHPCHEGQSARPFRVHVERASCARRDILTMQLHSPKLTGPIS